MGVLGQVAPPKPLGQEIRVALTSMLLMKRQWFTQRRAFLLSMRWNVGPPLNSLPVRTRGGVSASEAGFIQLSGLTLLAALKKNH